MEVTRESVTSSSHLPSSPPSPHLPLSLSACMVAGQLSGELSSFGSQLGMTHHGTGGEDEEGQTRPLPCSELSGSQMFSLLLLLLLFPFFFPPASLFRFCRARAPGARSFVWHAGRRVGRLTNCCRGREGHCFGVNIALGSYCYLSARHLNCNGDKCRCCRNAKVQNNSLLFELLSLLCFSNCQLETHHVLETSLLFISGSLNIQHPRENLT